MLNSNPIPGDRCIKCIRELVQVSPKVAQQSFREQLDWIKLSLNTTSFNSHWVPPNTGGLVNSTFKRQAKNCSVINIGCAVFRADQSCRIRICFHEQGKS